jgi:type 1 glutamine amidotransferase
VTYGKALAACVLAAPLLLSSCLDMRPLGTVTAGVGGGPGGGGSPGAGGAGGGPADPPIRVLVWNNALAYAHASRALAIPYFKAREATDGIRFDTNYAHIGTNYKDQQDGDTTFDASVFTDDGLANYDVVMFLNTTGNTIDDGAMTNVRRQALQDFIEKKGRGFVGLHSATDTYQKGAWQWYVDFIGANYDGLSPSGTMGTARYFQNMSHPILNAARTPAVWNRSEEWFVFTREPLFISGVTMLLTCHDQVNGTERPSAWIHEMPPPADGLAGGRMFYSAFGHLTSAFDEQLVMDFIIAGIKWAAGRL